MANTREGELFQTMDRLTENAVKPFRAMARLAAVLLWFVSGTLASEIALAIRFASPRFSRRLHHAIAKTMVRLVPKVLGMRIHVRGPLPQAPYVLVGNHISWMDFFVTNTLLDGVVVAEHIIEEIPVLRRILRGLDLIIVHRTYIELPDANRQIMEAMQAGKNIIMALEATVSPGRRVCHFHSALLDPVVRHGRPVHYASLTVCTPAGCPTASEVLLTPDPHFRPYDAEEEAACGMWGKDRGFLGYLVGLLTLPAFDYTVTFAETPISGTDRKVLAKDLQNAVQAIFTPVK